MIRNQTSNHNTITLESFARRVASAVSRFLGVSSLRLGISAVTIVILTVYISTGCRRPTNLKDKIQIGGSVSEG